MIPVLKDSEIKRLRALCKLSEKKGQLTPALLNIIFEKKWLKLFVPKKLNGLALSLPEALRYEEQLAYIDGSMGWTITLCAGANLFVGYIEKETAAKIFASNRVCLGGSGAVQGTASVTENGYIVTGHWKYATGAPHLTHFTANCKVKKDGKPLLDKNNIPVVKSFFFKRSEVTIHEDWSTMGLRATAGHSFSVSNLKISSDRCFTIDPSYTTLNQTIYKYPFLPFAAATTAINTLGMTKHFLEETLSIVENREKQKKLRSEHSAGIRQQVAEAQQKIRTVSDPLYDYVTRSWNILSSGHRIPLKILQKIEELSRKLAKQCRNEVATIYPYCGLAATSPESDINRVFRDIFTASQHGLLLFPNK